MKPAPGNDKFQKLAGHYFKDGFITASTPILVMPSRRSLLNGAFWVADDVDKGEIEGPWRGDMPVGYLGYVKGEGRSITLHAILVWCWVANVDLAACHPVLYSSILEIHVHMCKPRTRMAMAIGI